MFRHLFDTLWYSSSGRSMYTMPPFKFTNKKVCFVMFASRLYLYSFFRELTRDIGGDAVEATSFYNEFLPGESGGSRFMRWSVLCLPKFDDLSYTKVSSYLSFW